MVSHRFGTVCHSASSYQSPGNVSVFSSRKTSKFVGRRPTTSRTPILTASASSAATGTCHGAEGMSCLAGKMRSRMRRRTEPTLIFSRRAVSSTLMVFSRGADGSNGAILKRWRNSRTRRVVHDDPSVDLHRIRFMVTARSRSDQWPARFRITSTGLGWRSPG